MFGEAGKPVHWIVGRHDSFNVVVKLSKLHGKPYCSFDGWKFLHDRLSTIKY